MLLETACPAEASGPRRAAPIPVIDCGKMGAFDEKSGTIPLPWQNSIGMALFRRGRVGARQSGIACDCLQPAVALMYSDALDPRTVSQKGYVQTNRDFGGKTTFVALPI